MLADAISHASWHAVIEHEALRQAGEVPMNKKLIIAFAVFTAIGAGLFFILTTGDIGADYNTARVERGAVHQTVEEVGRVSSDGSRTYYGPGSRVEDVSVELGDPVQAGQLMIRFRDDLDLEIQTLETQIEALQSAYAAALAGADNESVESARIEIARIERDLTLARKNEERMRELYQKEAVSLTELEQASQHAGQLESSLAMARNAYDRLVSGVSQEERKRFEADIDVLQLTLQRTEERRKDYTVRADIDGVVTELNVRAGDQPAPGSVVLETQDPTDKLIQVDFLAQDARKIREGMPATIHDPDLGVHLDGLTVSRVSPKAFVMLSELGVQENRQTVEIRLPASVEGLAFGLQVRVQVLVSSEEAQLLIPAGAVHREGSKQVVKVLVDGEVTEREIVTGPAFDGSVVIRQGLEEGERVILNYQQ